MPRNVFTKDVWDRRKAMVWWVIGMAALGAWISAVYPVLRDSEAMKDFVEQFPPELLAMFGMNPDTFLTGAGFLQAQMYSFMAPIIALSFAIGAGVAATAREERNGTMDILLSAPVPRWSIVAQKAAAMALLTLVIVGSLGLTVLILNPVFGLKLSIEGVLSVSAGLWMLALVFGGTAMVIGAFTGSPTGAGGLAAGLAIVAWFVNAFAAVYEWLEWPSKLSPFSWYLHDTPLITGFNSGQVWLTITTVALVAGAIALFQRRNIATDRSIVPERAARKERSTTVKPRATRLLGSVFTKTIWDRRRTVWYWAVGLSSMSLLTFAAWPALSQDADALTGLVEAFPKELLAMFGLTDPKTLATPEGFISSRTYGSVGPIAVIVFGITAMSALVAREESSGVLDLVVSNSMRRARILGGKAGAVSVLLGTIAAFLLIVALIGNAAFDTGFGLYHMVAANIGLGLLGLCFWGIAVAVWSLFRGSGPAVGITAALAVGTYFLNGLGAIVDALAPFRYLSPFYWYLGDTVPLSKGLTFGYLALAAVALAGTLFAITRFEHRDLGV